MPMQHSFRPRQRHAAGGGRPPQRRNGPTAGGVRPRERPSAHDAVHTPHDSSPTTAPPTPEQVQLLLASPVDAARLGPSAAAMVRFIGALAPSSPPPEKRLRHELDAKPLLDLWDSVKPHIATLLVDEVGIRIVEALIRSGGSATTEESASEERSISHECIDAMVAAVEESAAATKEDGVDATAPTYAVEDMDSEGRDALLMPLRTNRVTDLYGLATHSIARVAVWAALECGTKAHRRTLYRALGAEALNLATDRHGVHCLLLLLTHYPKSRATIVPALLPIVSSTLMADPVGARTAAALVHPDTASDIAAHVLSEENRHVLESVISEEGMKYPWAGEQRRIVRFVVSLITHGLTKQGSDDDKDVDRRTAGLLQLHNVLSYRIVPLAVHEQGNFLVQSLLTGLASWNIPATDAALQHGAKLFAKCAAPSLAEVAVDRYGSHVIGALARSGASSSSIISTLRPHVTKLAVDKCGSIALRRLIEQCDTPERAHSMAAALLSSLGQEVPAMIRHEHGNLVIQAALKALQPAERARFFETHIKPHVMELAKHPWASHVVYCLISANLLDPAALNALFGGVKGRLVELATQVNGRFIVEKLLGLYRDAQQTLTDNIAVLLATKGSQQLLATLYIASAPTIQERIVAYVRNHLAALAVEQQGSLVLQKMMAAEQAAPAAAASSITRAIKDVLVAQPALTDRLRTHFFGRFVVQMATAPAVTER